MVECKPADLFRVYSSSTPLKILVAGTQSLVGPEA
jgi:hypothetical protein